MIRGNDTLTFSALPGLARFILDNHFDDYVSKEIAIAKLLGIPLWQKYDHIPIDVLIENSKPYFRDFLEAAANNLLAENLEKYIAKYRDDLLLNITREQITPDDFLLTHAGRKKAILSFMLDYTQDPELIMQIVDELDVITCRHNVSGTHAYVDLLNRNAEEERTLKDKLFSISPGYYYIYDIARDAQVLPSERLFISLGYNRYDYAGNNTFFREIMHPDDLLTAQTYFASLQDMQEGEVRFFEYRLRNRDGEYRWMRNYESVYKWNTEGTPGQLLGVALDITKERGFTDEIRAKEEALSEAQTLANMGAYTWDIKQNLLSGFSGNLSSLGVAEGKSFEEVMQFVHPADKPEVLGSFEKAVMGKREYECEYRCLINNRERVLWSRGKVSFENDQPRFFKATVMDVTEQHQMLRKLQKSEQLYKQAQTLNKIGNWSWYIDSNRIHWSDELYRIFGLAPQSEVVNYERFVSFLPQANTQPREEVLQGLQANPGRQEYYFPISTAEGEQKILYAQSEAILDEKGQLYKIIGTFQDVTEQKTLEKNLFDRTIQLQQSNASLKVFAYISSHDLKEPLRKISLFGDRLRMLNQKTMSEQSNNLLATIINSSLRLQQMIDEILSVSRINSDQNFQQADLDEILSGSLADIDVRIQEKSAVIKRDKLPVALVNKVQMRQLFTNLVSNALKFSKPGVIPELIITCDSPTVREINAVGLDNSSRYFRIRFRDNGIGFQQAYAEKIFAIFQRLHDKSLYKGTGIGLAICREIAGHHGGIITAEAVPNQGATFTLIIPDRITAALPVQPAASSK